MALQRCMRCGGPLSQLDELQGLCSGGPSLEHGCFMVFALTLVGLGIEVVPPRPAAEELAWWQHAYQRVAREGHVTL